MSITGFAHKGRGVGVRDHQLILPSVVCSTHVSRKIANEVGAITFVHQNGCGIIGIDVPGVDNFFKSEKAPLDKLIVGLDLSRDVPGLSAIKTALTAAGFEVVSESEKAVSEHNLSKLMSAKAQVVLSFPDENQPPSGFPLIPVINIASTSPLHMALTSEFDLAQDSSVEEIVALINAVANGQKTKSELSGIGEIVAPRSVRSV